MRVKLLVNHKINEEKMTCFESRELQKIKCKEEEPIERFLFTKNPKSIYTLGVKESRNQAASGGQTE